MVLMVTYADCEAGKKTKRLDLPIIIAEAGKRSGRKVKIVDICNGS